MAKQFMQIGLDLSVRNFAQFQSQISRSESSIKRLGDVTNSIATESQRLASALGVVGITLGVVGAAALGAAIPMDDLADTLERVTVMGNGVAGSMGITTDAMAKEREELNKLDVARGISYGVMNSLILQNVDYTKSSDLVATAMDLAAFSGKKVVQTIEDLTTAVDNASTRTLRQYRITASAEQVFASYARAHGLVANALKETEKRQAVLDYTLQIGQRYRGAYIASMETSEGITMRLGLRLQRLGEIIGAGVSPIIDSVVKALLGLVEAFIALPSGVQDSIGKMLLLVGGLGMATMTITLLLPGLKVIIAGFQVLPALISNTSVDMAAATTIGAKWNVFIAGMGAQFTRLGAWIVGLNPIVLGVAAALGLLAVAITTNFGGIRTYLGKLFAEIGQGLQKIWHDIKIWGTALIQVVGDVLLAPLREFDKQGKEAMDNLELTFSEGETRVEHFFLAGARLMTAFAEGLLAGFSIVLDAVQVIVNAVASFFVGQSPPPAGPLSKIDLGGMKIIQAWLDGMSSVSLAQVQVIAADVEKTLKSALWAVTDILFGIESQSRGLDKALWPYKDALTRVKAEAELITIPLLRQQRILQSQLDETKHQLDELDRALQLSLIHI